MVSKPVLSLWRWVLSLPALVFLLFCLLFFFYSWFSANSRGGATISPFCHRPLQEIAQMPISPSLEARCCVWVHAPIQNFQALFTCRCMKCIPPPPITFLVQTSSHQTPDASTWFLTCNGSLLSIRIFREITATTAPSSSLSWSKCSSKIFLPYSPCPRQDYIRIVDGSYTPIAGTGFVNYTPNITLSFVLYVLSFPVNLLSTNAFTNSLNCKVEFFPTHCILQNLWTEKRICTNRLQDDLYILDGNTRVDSNQALLSTNKDVTKEII